MSFGLAIGSLLASWLLFNLPQSDTVAITAALHKTFIILGVVTVVSSVSFYQLKLEDGKELAANA
jgi:esterase/lipase